MEKIKLWERLPDLYRAGEFEPTLEYYGAENKKGRGAIVICPGGGYAMRACHEGEGYAKYLSARGIDCFVLQYTTIGEKTEKVFPKPQLEIRRAIRYVRANAEKYGIDADKIAVMGSSAGGHLALSASAYREALEGEGADALDSIDFMPNGQILSYPVTDRDSHGGSYDCLLGDKVDALSEALNPISHTDEKTPPTFVWHTFTDNIVKIRGIYDLGAALARGGVINEMHVFPFGNHGLGISPADKHVARWGELLVEWLSAMGFLDLKN